MLPILDLFFEAVLDALLGKDALNSVAGRDTRLTAEWQAEYGSLPGRNAISGFDDTCTVGGPGSTGLPAGTY